MSPPREGTSAPVKKGNPVLIVVAIVGSLAATCFIGMGILVATLGPAFRQARENARTGICGSNLGSIGKSISMYGGDYDGKYPIGDKWMDLIEPYVPNRRMLQCPAVRQANRSAFGYALNRSAPGKRRSEFDQAVPLVFDSKLLGRNACTDLTSMPAPGRHPSKAGKVDNAVLTDGSLSALVK